MLPPPPRRTSGCMLVGCQRRRRRCALVVACWWSVDGWYSKCRVLETYSFKPSFLLSLTAPREIFVQCGGLNTEICLECKGLCTSSHPNTFEDMKLSPHLFPKCLVSNLSVFEMLSSHSIRFQ